MTTEVIPFRVSEAEQRQLKRLANSLTGGNMSRFVRLVVQLGVRCLNTDTETATAEEMRDRIATNLDIARRLTAENKRLFALLDKESQRLITEPPAPREPSRAQKDKAVEAYIAEHPEVLTGRRMT